MINKIQLLLSANDPLNKDKISDLIADEWNSIKQKLSNITHRRAVRVKDDPTAIVPQDGQPDEPIEQPSFDIMFEIRGEEISYDHLTDSLEGFGDKLESLINKNCSAVLLGKEYIIVPGSEPLFLNMVLRRPNEWSREDWHKHWLEHHAEEVLENVSGLQGYRQFHADEKASKRAAKKIGLGIYDYEGTAEGYYSDIEKFLETLSDPEVSKDTGFIDHRRSVMWLYNIYE